MTAKELVIGYEEPLSRPLTFAIERGEKIVLTGANGIGKTTLLKSILGLIPSLRGDVELGDYLEIGYFEQEMPKGNTNSCIQEIWEEFPSYTQYEVRAALAKCGLTTQHIESLVRVLSGGEQAKVRLCKLINRETNLLVLDEPTNHLDVDAKEELKNALKEYKGTVLMVCHEPEFYDGLATSVWDCSEWTTKVILPLFHLFMLCEEKSLLSNKQYIVILDRHCDKIKNNAMIFKPLHEVIRNHVLIENFMQQQYFT